MERDLLCEFSDFGADYFLAIFWLDYVEICGGGGVRGLYVGNRKNSYATWRGNMQL